MIYMIVPSTTHHDPATGSSNVVSNCKTHFSHKSASNFREFREQDKNRKTKYMPSEVQFAHQRPDRYQ